MFVRRTVKNGSKRFVCSNYASATISRFRETQEGSANTRIGRRRQVCTDLNPNCTSWAASGECSGRAASYTLAVCPLSCELCSSQSSTRETRHSSCPADKCSNSTHPWLSLASGNCYPVSSKLYYIYCASGHKLLQSKYKLAKNER